MATLHVRLPRAEFAFHNRREASLWGREHSQPCGVAYYVSKIVLLIVAVVYLVSAAKEATAACSYKSLEMLPPLTRSDAMPMTVVFGPSDRSNTDEAISRFGKAMESTKPKILEVAGEVKTLTFDEETEVEQIYRRGRGMVAVIDPQFMKEAKPKYNSLLLSFKDTTIAADQILILDPWPIGENMPTGKPDRAFIQITNTITPEMLPYLLELAAYLWYDPSLFSTPEFAKYASLVTDEAADGGSLHPSTLKMRESVIVICLDMRLGEF
jgi:hypothetical protein